MSKLSLGGRKRPTNPVPEQRQQWRARDVGPISLSARPTVDSATGQKAFVLAFAAVAVAGAAYFATMMLSPEDSRANARPVAEAQASGVASPAPITAEAPASAPSNQDVASADPSSTGAAPAVFPAPKRVKTVMVPKTSAAAPTASDTVADAATQLAGPDPTLEHATETTTAADTAVAAYATDDPIVSEGIEAVMGIAAAPTPDAPRKKKEAAKGETQVASAGEPEMAGSGKNTRRIRSGVNMRAAPKSGSQIIGTIPTNASVTVAPGCKQWCSVSYNGKRGFIYKSFLR